MALLCPPLPGKAINCFFLLHPKLSLQDSIQHQGPRSWRHCLSHPQSSGKVERTIGIVKLKMSKFAQTTGLPRPKILLTIQRTQFGNHKLTPQQSHQQRDSRLVSTGVQPSADPLPYASATSYCKSPVLMLRLVINRLKKPSQLQFKGSCWSVYSLMTASSGNFTRGRQPSMSREGTLLTTNTAAKLVMEPWIHISQLNKVPLDIWSCSDAADLQIKQTSRGFRL